MEVGIAEPQHKGVSLNMIYQKIERLNEDTHCLILFQTLKVLQSILSKSASTAEQCISFCSLAS